MILIMPVILFSYHSSYQRFPHLSADHFVSFPQRRWKRKSLLLYFFFISFWILLSYFPEINEPKEIGGPRFMASLMLPRAGALHQREINLLV